MKIKKLPLFYRIFLSVLTVFVICLTVFLIALSNNLKEYNKGIPETVSEKFFTDVFVKKNTEKIIEMSGFIPCEFETYDDIHTFVENRLTGDLTYTSVSNSGDNSSKKYIIKSGEYKLATFFLKPDNHGDYYVDSLILHLPKNTDMQVRVLDSSILYLNGLEVGEKYIISKEPHENAAFLPENVPSPMWVTYKISGLTKEPTFTVTDRNSNLPELVDSNGVLTEQIIYDEQEAHICNRILEGAKQYAACMQNDVSKGQVLPYFEKGTDIYESIRTVENAFVWDHAGYAFEDEKVSEFFKYDENTVSLRITFTHILKMYGRDDFRDATDITYFARNNDGVYKIYATHNN